MKFLSKNIKINIVLVIGLSLIFVGILLLTGYFAKHPQTIYLFRGVFLFIIGAIILFIELMKSSKTWLMFVSIALMLCSIILGMIDVGFFPWGLRNLWPSFVIIFGVSLILFSLYKNSKIRATYLIPALVFILFGIFFMLFSMNLIKTSFVSLASKLWPLLLVLCGATLIVIYFIQSNNLEKNTQSKVITTQKDDE